MSGFRSTRPGSRFLFNSTKDSGNSFPGAIPEYPAITGQTLDSPSTGFSGALGFKFTVGALPLTVIKLGRWIISGNNQMHTLRIYAADGTTILASTSINANGAPINAYLYANLVTPYVLAASTSYFMMSVENSDSWPNSATIVVPNSDLTIQGSALDISPVTLVGSANTSYIPPNFIYQK